VYVLELTVSRIAGQKFIKSLVLHHAFSLKIQRGIKYLDDQSTINNRFRSLKILSTYLLAIAFLAIERPLPLRSMLVVPGSGL